MNEDIDLRNLLKRNAEVLVAIGVFSTLAIGIQSYIPGILGFFIAAMSIIITIVFFISFLSDLVNHKLNPHLKGIFVGTLSSIFLGILLHLFFGISRKPLSVDFYMGLVVLFISLEVIILSIVLNLFETIKDKVTRNKILQTMVSIVLFVLPFLLSYLTYKIGNHAINLYAEKYYPNL